MPFQHSLRDSRPIIDVAVAAQLARGLFAKDGNVLELPSERDRNFRITDSDGARWVLKIAQADEERRLIELQNSVLQHLAQASAIPVPAVCSTVDGELIGHWSDGARSHLVRMLTYLPGVPLASVRPRSNALLRDLGRRLGQLDAALELYQDDTADRALKWDFRHAAAVLADHIPLIGDPAQRELVNQFHEQFEQTLYPLLPDLRRSIIQNDANDHNVLVHDSLSGQSIAGLIDFGDIVHSYTVGEVAIAAAYAIFGEADPAATMATITSGYHEQWPLTEAELSVVFPLVCLRLCMSVCISAKQKAEEPENAYLSVSERSAWAALHRLSNIHHRLAEAIIRQACGLAPFAAHPRVTTWICEHASQYHALIKPEEVPHHDCDVPDQCSEHCDGTYFIHDLSIDGLDDSIPMDEPQLCGEIFASERHAEGAAIGIGRYSEPRVCYTGDQFQEQAGDGQWRTIHLGIDLFESAGTAVFAPLDGEVHSFADNDLPLDYGPTLILKHQPAEDIEFFMLYGHLSRDSIARWQVGKRFVAGQQIGELGDVSENGGWPPHLHFQVMLDLLNQQGDFPGVGPADHREVWEHLIPDPSPFVQTRLPICYEHRDPDTLIAHRRQRLAKSLSISYDRPLEIVRGAGPYLFDSMGRKYLDCVNNVAHVGHCHPHVVESAQRQTAILNTNTRYLNTGLLDYADRLASLFPEPLEVVFLVCSGSEANELALRLAKVHTGHQGIAGLEAGYHGNTAALIDASSYKCDGPGGKGPGTGVAFAPLPDVFRGLHRGADATERYLENLQTVLDQLADECGLAAFIAESMPGCGGQIELPAGYLEGAYAAVRARGGVCIADEVQTGFGRVGTHFWAFETQDVVPDIVSLGKPIGNGHPLGAVITTRAIADSFANGMEYFNTFGGNNVSCAIGMAVLDVIEEQDLQQHARSLGGFWLEKLRDLQEQHPMIGDVRGRGLFLGVELIQDEQRAPAADAAHYIVNRLRSHRILASTDGPQHNVIKIKPPMTISRKDVEYFCAVLKNVLDDSCLRSVYEQ